MRPTNEKAARPGKGSEAREESNSEQHTRTSDSFHWFPLYFADHYLQTIHLSGDAHSALVRLLCSYAMRRGPLPDTDADLAKICGLTLKAWREVRPCVEPFFEVASDYWRHAETDDLIARAEAKTQERRKAAGARWAKVREANAMQTHSKSNADAQKYHCKSIENQNQIEDLPSGRDRAAQHFGADEPKTAAEIDFASLAAVRAGGAV